MNGTKKTPAEIAASFPHVVRSEAEHGIYAIDTHALTAAQEKVLHLVSEHGWAGYKTASFSGEDRHAVEALLLAGILVENDDDTLAVAR